MSEDRLRMDYINSLGQLFVNIGGSSWWPLESIDVQTGIFRIDVVGLLQPCGWREAVAFRDELGNIYDPESFEVEATPCGAPKRAEGRERIYWDCGTNSAKQSELCARYVRTRISQLKRMSEKALYYIRSGLDGEEKTERRRCFYDACLREIDRLRGAQ